jgi:hypothetical protein
MQERLGWFWGTGELLNVTRIKVAWLEKVNVLLTDPRKRPGRADGEDGRNSVCGG